MAGPLTGVRIVEIAGLGPGPFACMMLADHGAEVIRVERPGGGSLDHLIDPTTDVMARSRQVVEADLKSADGVALVRQLAKSADGFVEGFRPGVMERLGLGPETLLADNPKLVYGRVTGWGQSGPYAQLPGHDLNYIALAGTLDPLGRAGTKPTPPINLLGDFGGGGMMLAFGMVSAILHARTTGEGQVVDCAMADASAVLMSMIWGLKSAGAWQGARGENMLDTGAPFYEVYETADGLHIAIAAIEPQFYACLLQTLGLERDPGFARQMDRAQWPAMKARLTEMFRSRTREQWCALLEPAGACFAPVLSMDEAPLHPHLVQRATFVEADGVLQPAPVPRYSKTATAPPRMPPKRSR